MADKRKRRKRLERTVKQYQARIRGVLRGPLVTLLTPWQLRQVRTAARESGESVSFVLAAIIAHYFGDEPLDHERGGR